MGEVVNLNQYRKERAKVRRRRVAQENRNRFGMNKVEREESRHSKERRGKDLDGKRLEHGGSTDDPPNAS